MKFAHAMSIYGIAFGVVFGTVSSPVFAQATPVRSSIESSSYIYLSVVDESDESDVIDDQLNTLDLLGTTTATTAINSSQGSYSSVVHTAAEFVDANHGEFESSMSYEGMMGSGDIQAQRFGHSLHGIFEYDFMIPADGVLNVLGLLSNQGPSPIQFNCVLEVFAESSPGNGFTGAFYSQIFTDSNLDTEPIEVSLPLTSSSGSYRVRMRLSHSGLGSLDRTPLAGSLTASWSIDSNNPCPADLNGDGALNFFDVSDFLSAFGMMDSAADFNGDGALNFFDVSAFLEAFGDGCP